MADPKVSSSRPATPRRVLLIGATGMVGGHVLRLSLERDDVLAVTAIGRRPCGVVDAKLRDVVHSDFLDLSAVGDVLIGQDVALYCLGAYTGAVPDDEFRRITLDYTVAFVDAFRARSPNAVVCFLSGQGADQTEKSRLAFSRYKGAAEKALLAAGFARVHIFRPGYIYPTTSRREPNFGYQAMRALYPLMRRVYPNVGIASEDLARAMLLAGLSGTAGHDDPVLENRDIRALAG